MGAFGALVVFLGFSYAHLIAIARRSTGDNLAALALPPFNPPSRPSATAAGFFLRERLGMRST